VQPSVGIDGEGLAGEFLELGRPVDGLKEREKA
jgi:hypothetical protein